MSILSDAQIIALWVNEGGSITTAPMALARALSESSGNTSVTSSNPDGGTNVGLYQLDTKGVGSGYTVQQLSNPYLNTQITLKATNGGQNWGSWADNYTAFLSQADSAVSSFSNTGSNIQNLLKNVTTAGAGGTAKPQQQPPPPPSSSASTSDLNPGGVLKGAEGLFHGLAVVLDYFFGMFGRGQGWRFAFTLAAIAAAYLSYRSLLGGSRG